MHDKIYIASLLYDYTGPSLNQLIEEAIAAHNDYMLDISDKITKVTVSSKEINCLCIKDIYYYDENNKLIKQLLVVNDKEKVVFDKNNEILSLFSDKKFQYKS